MAQNMGEGVMKEIKENGFVRWKVLVPIAVTVLLAGLGLGATAIGGKVGDGEFKMLEGIVDKKADKALVDEMEKRITLMVKSTSKETYGQTKIFVRESEENIKQFMRNEIKELRQTLK